jgi:hypothetical protein
MHNILHTSLQTKPFALPRVACIAAGGDAGFR